MKLNLQKPKKSYNVEFKNKTVNFKQLDNRLKTFDLCILALTNDIHNFKYIPVQYQTERFVIELFEKYYNSEFTFNKSRGSLLSAIPTRLITKKIAELALSKDISSAEHVPVGILSERYIINNIKIVKHLNTKLFTQKISNCAVNYSPNFIQYIPKEYITQEISDLAVSYNINNLQLIPKKYRTYDLLINCREKLSKHTIISSFDINSFTNDQIEYLQLLNIL